VSHFEVFGIPQRFDLDANALEKRFRELSLALHPDRATKGADAKERRLALERTTALNEAHKILRDPVRRAFYLLKLYGVDLDREDAGSQKDMPAEFLEEVIELREQLAEARLEKDLPRAQAMAKQVEQQQEDALESAVNRLRALEKSPGDAAALKDAAHQLGRVRYFTRFLEEVELIEEEALG
jgi:molecular chaperone HscB